MHARVHTSGAQAAKSSIAGRRGRQGIGGIQPLLSSAPCLQAGRGVVSLGRTTPTHAEQQGGAGGRDPQARRGVLRRQPQPRPPRTRSPPRRPGNPHQTTGACVTPGGARAHAREGAPRERKPSSGEGGHTGAKTPRRGCRSAAGRAAPSAAQAARMGVRSDREGASPRRSRRAASPPPR